MLRKAACYSAIFMLLLLVATACQPQAQKALVAQSVAVDVLDTPTLTAPPTRPPNPVVVELATATPPQSFVLTNPQQTELTQTAVAQQTVAAQPTETAVPPETAVGPSATPRPTFTPPSLPYTSADDHYWLRRPVADGGIVWTDKEYPYGSNRDGTLRTHHGVEFNVANGTEILAAASGTVIVAGNDSEVAYGPETNFYGNLIIIQLDSTYKGQPVYNLYGHLSEIFVAAGQRVDVYDVIALSGASGVADGPHMHFEVRQGQNSYLHTRNPLLWLYPFSDRGTVVGQVLWPTGELVTNAPLQLKRIDAPSRYAVTTSYADDFVNGDDIWQENFAFDDVHAGFYELILDTGEREYKAEVWVLPFRTAYVELIIGE